MSESRNQFIDFLRFVGLALIIFAHVQPPSILFQIRNFDVPLMVLVSAMSFSLSYKPNRSYGAYIWSRIKRLVFPVWIFLTIYFAGIYVFDAKNADLNTETILTSYALVGGIGYVWVVWVFLLVALTAPFIYKQHLTKTDPVFISAIVALYVAYEICLFYTRPYIEGLWLGSALVVYYLLPYSLIFALGLKIPHFSAQKNLMILALSLVTFVVLAVYLYLQNGHLVATQHYKYPPTAYYLSFALFMCMCLWLVGERIWQIVQILSPVKKTILFIAQNSLWVYFWHIPFVEFLHLNFILEYVIAFSAATVITVIQVRIAEANLQSNQKVMFSR